MRRRVVSQSVSQSVSRLVFVSPSRDDEHTIVNRAFQSHSQGFLVLFFLLSILLYYIQQSNSMISRVICSSIFWSSERAFLNHSWFHCTAAS